MKTKINPGVLLLVVFMASFSFAAEPKNDWSEMKLMGKVKSIRQLSYLAVEKDGKAQKRSRPDEVTSRGYDSFKIVFNTKGNKIEKQWLKLDGSLETRHTYKYDAKGRLIVERRVGEQQGKCVSKYDAKGNKTQESCSDQVEGTESKSIYKYDEKGNLIEQNCADCSPESKTTYKYDEKGNLAEATSEKDDFLAYVSKYDESGNPVEQNAYDLGSPTSKFVNIYDEKGNLTEMKSYATDGNLNSTTTYKYNYDTAGNWVQQIEYDGAATPKYILERTIKYFNDREIAAAGRTRAKKKK
ncbi:MAG: hypothetical protein Q7R35_15635 [Elusimicrobiota bacterium]|nr:hypothetical protein [Elusimicrobiota bacterium]